MTHTALQAQQAEIARAAIERAQDANELALEAGEITPGEYELRCALAFCENARFVTCENWGD